MKDLQLTDRNATFDEFTAAVSNCTDIISPVCLRFSTLLSLSFLYCVVFSFAYVVIAVVQWVSFMFIVNIYVVTDLK